MITTALRRFRSSTAPSSAPPTVHAAKELHSLIHALRHTSADQAVGVTSLDHTSQVLLQLRQLLVDTADEHAKDAFGRLHGFQALLDLLRHASHQHDSSASPALASARFFELLQAVLSVLAEALHGHPANRRYFAKHVTGGGWTELEQALAGTGTRLLESDGEGSDTSAIEQLLGCLFAFALKDDTLVSMFGDVRRSLVDTRLEGAKSGQVVESQTGTAASANRSTTEDKDQLLPSSSILTKIRTRLQVILGSGAPLQNPEIIPIICRVWFGFTKRSRVKDYSDDCLPISVGLALTLIIQASKYNLNAVHSTGILSLVLAHLFDSQTPDVEVSVLKPLADMLITLGTSNMDDSYSLFKNATLSPDVADFLLRAIRSSRQPSHVHFDLSLHGFSSIELSSLRHTFPPISSSNGYSFTAWVYIDRFDQKLHTTIFGAFDSSQTCFVLAYLERDTQNFILQTSVTSSKPSVRFKSKTFIPGQWYHIGLVHFRPRPTSSSRAALFVDGECVEQLKCQYPSSPPLLGVEGESFASLTSASKKYNSVQVFLGTPRDLSTRLGQDVTHLQWSLASFHLFDDALTDGLMAVYYRLGPRYNGNFQDCLGSFQTYEASAALNLRSEMGLFGKAQISDMMTAIKSKASNLLQESRILLNISPSSTLDINGFIKVHNPLLRRSLSKQSAGNLQHLTRYGGNSIAINGAIPSINKALNHPHGAAILAGEPVVCVPLPLDDVSWRVGGCAAVGLKMIELATCRDSVICAVQILLETVRENWRNSEAMEKENAFSILGMLIREKLGMGLSHSTRATAVSGSVKDDDEARPSLGFELLNIILSFVGYKNDQPKESIITNPLAYRILLVDHDIWRRSALPIQKLYFKQFVVFGSESKYHDFNSKRLSRMRIIRKLLDALKVNPFSSDILLDFAAALRSLVESNASAEVFRALSLYITYALRKHSSTPTKSFSSTQSTLSSRRTPLSPMTTESSRTVPSTINQHIISQDLGLTDMQRAIMVLDVYADLLCATSDSTHIKKFGRTVTNKWLLYLLAEDNYEVVKPALYIVTRLLTVHGITYINKFTTKTGGFCIMTEQLKKWWREPTTWYLLFVILFDQKPYQKIPGKICSPDDLQSFVKNGNGKVIYPEVLPVIFALLGTALRSIAEEDLNRDSSSITRNSSQTDHEPHPSVDQQHQGKERISTNSTSSGTYYKNTAENSTTLVQAVLHLLASLHNKYQTFRDFATSSTYIQELLYILFPVLVRSEPTSASTELHHRASATDLIQNCSPLHEGHQSTTSVSSALLGNVASTHATRTYARPRPAQRASSFVLVSSYRVQARQELGLDYLSTDEAPNSLSPSGIARPQIESLTQLIISVLSDQIFGGKDFHGFGLFLKSPPGLPELQAKFESYLLGLTVAYVHEKIISDTSVLDNASVVNNIARMITHLSAAILEGWFLHGVDPVLDMTGTVLEYFQGAGASKLSRMQACNQAIVSMKTVFLTILLLSLFRSGDEQDGERSTVSFLQRMSYWHMILLGPNSTGPEFVRLLCHVLYEKLVDGRREIRSAAASFWRILLVQKPAETTSILEGATARSNGEVFLGFQKLKEIDDDTFLDWVDSHGEALEVLFRRTARYWDRFVTEQIENTEAAAKARIEKRKDRLKQWASDELASQDILRRHRVAWQHWMVNVYSSEHLKHNRANQDQQDNLNYIFSLYKRLDYRLRRPCGLFEDMAPEKWRLDPTEGRNRMRLRLVPDLDSRSEQYRPKYQKRQSNSTDGQYFGHQRRPSSSGTRLSDASPQKYPASLQEESPSSTKSVALSDTQRGLLGSEEDFEMIDDPLDSEGNFEDKNRMVMRSLQRGEQIQHVHNVSRIVGLEACEGLLILGKTALYLLDSFFQRSDGEIVNAWQAPQDERDPYLQMISGHQVTDRPAHRTGFQREPRHWKWTDVVSISKRRFLFRDVAVELFFTDGRSYLLTTGLPEARDQLYSQLAASASHVHGNSEATRPENSWRLEALSPPDDIPQSLGSKFVNAFHAGQSSLATRSWAKGEISNFSYLMLVNTMAGRTFNDLTQYPVFPWVLADYTSDELDFTDPRTFRDFSKPMGAQSLNREADFKERYQAFAEMGDHNDPPFHYGTHYSSAMIVTSYLIRLQPFVQSYLLLQGGNFDHADRMFYSVEKAWISASRDNMTDVRELIPEFFYLPEFLENSNGFNFGQLQSTGESIDSVKLPPWAKGDSRIFIAKHREALESPYVSKHLHQWIDLVFGFKQRGEAAIEATNVFQHLSYFGARDLDTIHDPVERLATIGIIHNFGQTPYQVFQRAHPSREVVQRKPPRLDAAVEELTRLPNPIHETNERVHSLVYSTKHERLLCSAPLRVNIPLEYDKYLEWGFIDDGVRFYLSDSRKLVALFEHIHQGQLTCVLFADSKTLITASTDSTVAVWAVELSSKTVDLEPRATLFGHRSPITSLAVSRPFSTILSVSTDGQALLWDLNRLQLVRQLASGKPVECAQIKNTTGEIALCHAQTLALYTLNGHLLLEQSICAKDDCITSCAFYEGVGNEWLQRDLLFTGHKRGVVNVWSKVIRAGRFELDLVTRLYHVDPGREHSFDSPGCVTCILPMAHVVYTGDEDGKVYEWNIVQHRSGSTFRR